MGTGIQTQGVILTNAIRSVDLNTGKAKKVEKAPIELDGIMLSADNRNGVPYSENPHS
jgi:mRNA-degrading endonuclease toxin of MazEF toxin-antitoxin module